MLDKPLPLQLRILALLCHRDGLRRAQAEPIASGGPRPAAPGEDADVVLTLYTYLSAVEDFLAVAHATGWIEPFDWVAWKGRAEALVADPELLADADATTLGKLLTTHVRQERFCDGHISAMVGCGHFEALGGRLAALFDEDAARGEPAGMAFRDAPGPFGQIGTITPLRLLVLGHWGREGASGEGGVVQLRCLACGEDSDARAEDLEVTRCPACQVGEPEGEG